VTAQLAELRSEARALHESSLLQLQVSAAARVDAELQQRVLAFTRELDDKKEKAALFVLQLFNQKTREIGSQSHSHSHSHIIDCLQFCTDGWAEPGEVAALSEDNKVADIAKSFLDIVNEFYCHKVDALVLDPHANQSTNLVADEHSKGKGLWIR
jgi:hypothetical protein